ncbi:MAG TPA: hypothetical protein VMX54_05420 [Vicinamibacteria bacterium]|nr:hypothetical protein [Vicinamibacteria bacterium]
MPCRTASPVALALLTLLLSALAAAADEPERPATARETAAAREQARLCERLSGMPAVEACRAALALGVSAARRPAIRELLARQLVTLERWDELAELYREQVRLGPDDAAAWQRLGSTLLYALGLPAEAIGALQQSVRLAPDAEAFLTLAVALATVRRSAEALAAFEAALRLDPHVLDGRPASRDLYEAARQGRPWP